MKNQIILFFCLIGIPAFAQNLSSEKVPTTVLTAFKIKFPNIKKVEWEKEDTKYFEAEFKINHQEQSVLFDEHGNWIRTETDIKISQLPSAIQDMLFIQYKGFKAEEANKIEDLLYGISYGFEIEKGKEEFEMVCRENGELISKIAEKED